MNKCDKKTITTTGADDDNPAIVHAGKTSETITWLPFPENTPDITKQYLIKHGGGVDQAEPWISEPWSRRCTLLTKKYKIVWSEPYYGQEQTHNFENVTMYAPLPKGL